MPTETKSTPFTKEYVAQTDILDVDIVSGNKLFHTSSTQKAGSMSGVNLKTRVHEYNPKWRDQVKRHDNASTTFVASEDKYELGSGSSSSVIITESGGIRRTTTVRCSGVFPCYPVQVSVSSDTLNRALAAAKAKFFKKVAEKQVPFQGGVFLGELRETLHMIRHPAEGLYKLILGEQFLSTKAKLKRASLRNRRPLTGKNLKRSISKAAADTWLENAFGWQPFINDCESAMKVYNESILYTEYVPIRLVGQANDTLGVGITPGWSINGFVEYATHEVKTHECKVHVYGQLRNTPAGSRAKIGLTWGQFVPTVWELIPFSFLVDYFSNIGDVLSAVSVDLGALQWVGHTRVNTGVNKCTFQSFRSIAGSGPVFAIGSGGHSPIVRRAKEVSRFPTFDVSSPPGLKFEFPFSPRKWANMGALITGIWQGGISAHYGRGRA